MNSISVFPGLVSDVDYVVMRHLDDDSQVVLSGVSHLAYTRFSNGVYFQNRFNCQYAQIPGISLMTLTTYHPSNCWKVACCVLSSGVFNPNKSFLEEAIPQIKSGLEAQLKEICGSYYEDPSSPIHQAWITRQEFERKSCEAVINLLHFRDLLLSSHTQQELTAILAICLHQPSKFISENDRALEERFSEEELKIMKLDLFPCYQAMANHSQQTDILLHWDRKYQSLETERADLQSKLDSIVPLHISILENEFKNTIAVKHLPLLTECSNFLSIDGDQISTPENLCAIRNSINSCSVSIKTFIWQELYNRCARGVQEERWSENHFHEFLYPLFEIIKPLLDGCKAHVPTMSGS